MSHSFRDGTNSGEIISGLIHQNMKQQVAVYILKGNKYIDINSDLHNIAEKVINKLFFELCKYIKEDDSTFFKETNIYRDIQKKTNSIHILTGGAIKIIKRFAKHKVREVR